MTDSIENIESRRDETVDVPSSKESTDSQSLEEARQKKSLTSTYIIFEKKLVVAFIIIPFAIAGVLIRIALQRLETYEGAPVFPLIYAQWIGCFIMGIATSQKVNIMSIYHPLQVGISTGLCGSITTFSSWQLGIFSSFANIEAYDHTHGKNVLSAISQLLVTLAMSLNGYHFGRHIGEWLDSNSWWNILINEKKLKFKKDDQQQIDFPKIEIVACGFSINKLIFFDYLVILIGIISWIGVIIAAIFTPVENRELVLATVFSPVGALLRWYLSFFNGRFPSFPIGTFLANILGTLVLAIISLFRYNIYTSPLSCIIIAALADGFCGCLSTISTFVVEITTLNLGDKYIYASTSIIIGQCIMFVVLGSFIWTHGVNVIC